MPHKLRCVLLDDELHGLEYLRLMCGRFPFVDVVRCFNDPLRYVQEAHDIPHDAVLLDIDMPGLDGLQVARSAPDVHVVFITAHERFAADAFDLDAVDFIRKPITEQRLGKALDKALQRKGKATEGHTLITVMTDRGRTALRSEDIRYVTTPDQEKRDKLLHLRQGPVLRLKNITVDQLLAMLPARSFGRVNRSDLVALDAVHVVAGDRVMLHPVREGDAPLSLALGNTFREPFLAVLGERLR